MMRYIRYLCIAIFAVALIAIAVANRNLVEIKVLPEEMANLFALAPRIELPLFIIIYGGILVGLLVGFIWEWIREHGQRAEAARREREMRRMEREIQRLKGEKHRGKDEVLALLDEAS